MQAEIGHDVILVDADVNRTADLNRGEVPIHEHLLPQLLQRHRGKRLTFSSSVRAAVLESEAVFITVGTPQADCGEPDLSYVESVAAEIASAISGPKLVVEKSTVPVCTCECIRKVLLLHGVEPGHVSVASNPEFLREGTAVTDFLFPDRIVMGVDDDFSAAMLYSIYRPLTEGTYYRQEGATPCPGMQPTTIQTIVTNARSAQLIKHASNAFLAMKISYINVVANIAETVGADIDQVCAGIGSDPRIGRQFLQAGIGYGGSCFPRMCPRFIPWRCSAVSISHFWQRSRESIQSSAVILCGKFGMHCGRSEANGSASWVWRSRAVQTIFASRRLSLSFRTC